MTSTQGPVGANVARSPRGGLGGLGRLAAWCYDHRRRVLLGWLLAVVAIIGLAQWAGPARRQLRPGQLALAAGPGPPGEPVSFPERRHCGRGPALVESS